MHLTFIGKDGSLGLKHGKQYYVEIVTKNGMLQATIYNGLYKCGCPYSSPQSFAENWKK
jgi:hypothetical protein